MDGSPYGSLEAALEPNEHGKGMDMCSINPNYLGKKYRYAYACGAQRPCNFPNTLTKVRFLISQWHIATDSLWYLQILWDLVVQIDLAEKKAKNWCDEGSIPSEPFFVARPGATEEDDGETNSVLYNLHIFDTILPVYEFLEITYGRILLDHHTKIVNMFQTGVVISIISDKNGEGYALLLDGSTFEEIARAKFPYGLPYGLHGCWVPKTWTWGEKKKKKTCGIFSL